jgi:hypothetical protein
MTDDERLIEQLQQVARAYRGHMIGRASKQAADRLAAQHARIAELEAVVGELQGEGDPKIECVGPLVNPKVGDYALFTKYSDRSPHDGHAVGFISEILDDRGVPYYRVSNKDGSPIDRVGLMRFRYAWEITPEQGHAIVEQGQREWDQNIAALKGATDDKTKRLFPMRPDARPGYPIDRKGPLDAE